MQAPVTDKVGQKLDNGSAVVVGCRGVDGNARAVTGEVVSFGQAFCRIKLHEGTRTITRKPWDVVVYKVAA